MVFYSEVDTVDAFIGNKIGILAVFSKLERFLRSYLNFGVLPWKMNYSFGSEGQVELYVWYKQIPFYLPYFFLGLIEFL